MVPADPTQNKSAPRIPPISHLVWITDPSNPAEFREKDLERLAERVKLFSHGAYNWKFYLWVNVDEKLLPKTRERCAGLGVELKNIDTLQSPLRLLAQRLAKDKKYVLASDIIRILVVSENGGLYTDNDYSFYQNIDIYIMNFDSIFGFDGHRQVSLGNAFIAAVPRHPVLLAAYKLLMRNLLGVRENGETMPHYITHPQNLLVQILMTTGPIMLTLAAHKAVNTDGNKDLIFPHGVVLMCDTPPPSVQKVSYCEENGSWFVGKCANPINMAALGNDSYQGSWVAKGFFEPLDKYPVPLIGEQLYSKYGGNGL